MNTIKLNTIGILSGGGNAGGGGNSGGGSTEGYAPIPNGVYIQHINRKLYTPEEWAAGGYASADANGVAVVDDEANFVVSKDKSEALVWSSSYTNVIPGVYANSSQVSAVKDMSGRQNTRLILELANDGAALFCANYTFPNGKKGYLPSLGEWNIALSNKTAILDAMALIDGAPLDKGYQWSSTQSTSNNSAWYIDFSSGYISKTDKNWGGCIARPFTSL